MTTPSQDQIARIAHAIWESEGQPTGRDHEHWMRARQLIEEGRAEIEYPEAAGAGDTEDGAPQSAQSDPDEPSTGMFPYTKNRVEPRKEPGERDADAQDDADVRAEPGENPGPRNPTPLPPTNAEGYAEVPSSDDAAAGAVAGDPQPPQAVGGAGSARRSGAMPKPLPSDAKSGRNR
jgi:hypothetical protein